MKRCVLVCLMFLPATSLAVANVSAQSTDQQDWAIVTDDDASPFPGCDAVTVIDVTTGGPVAYGKQFISPGRLTLAGDTRWILSQSNNSGGFVTILSRLPGMRPRWNTNRVAGQFVQGGPIAISPDDTTLLVTRVGGVGRYLTRDLQPTGLGPDAGFYDADDVAGLLFTNDSATAIVVRAGGSVDFLDAQTLKKTSTSLPYRSIALPRGLKIRQTFAAITRDDRYLVINTGTGELNILDLHVHISSLIPADDISTTYGLSFNYASGTNRLAVHGHSRVAIYDIMDSSRLQLLGTVNLPPQKFASTVMSDQQYARHSTLAWTGHGDGLIAAIGGREEYRVFDVKQQSDQVAFTRRLDFDVCTSRQYYESELDVVTLNNRYLPPTPTLEPPTVTSSPTATPGPATFTPTPPPTATPTATSTSTPPPTATPTPLPAPLYIPLALRERCTPAQRHADVVLVIDASTSMLDVDASGVVKLDAALAAARAFVGLLTLGAGDQAAVVSFNAEAHMLQALTADKAALDAAFTAVTVRSLTCLVCGVEAAAGELASGRQRAGNTAVIVLLTDGRSNPQPASAAEAAAGRAKDAGVTVFTIGLGEDVDGEALAAMAAPTGKYYRAPTGAELTAIYADVAGAIPCPAGAFWGRR